MDKFRIKPNLIKLAEDKSVAKTVQILRCGTFNHAEYGEFQITKETLNAFKQNFSDRVRGIDLAIDYSHEADKEAAGWIKDLFFDETGTELWANVEWTPDGAKAIEAKKYRYLSADFTFAYVDAESSEKFGPTLLGAGLTNRPFVKDMAPTVELKEGEIHMTLDEAKGKISKLESEVKKLNEDYGMSPEDMKKKITKLEEDLKCAIDDKKKLEEKHAADTKMAEKKSEFDKLMTEGTVVEAQRDSFMKNDMDGFIKLAQKPNPKAAGHGDAGKDAQGDGKKSAQEEVIELAEKVKAEKKVGHREAIATVLKENPKLAERYAKETE